MRSDATGAGADRQEGRAVGIKQTEEQAEEEVAVGAINYKRTDGGVILVRGMGIFLEFAQADLKERDRTTGEPLVAYVAFVCSTYGTVESGRHISLHKQQSCLL
ncbi:hypothetical protein AAFF_G00298990 [Aldrovandia affinis]|uniref:Uncharacterized protein n=1 Tax=Aldrovandia affinis TaxID=143900 RepID=A0AAD7R9C6_9TELE|nr:hypothetical protein AAFF_G00298990 [Aldrovandia affinis]